MGLTISRSTGESFWIEGGIRVMVVRVKGDAVRLNIDADDKKVLREELMDSDEVRQEMGAVQ